LQDSRNGSSFERYANSSSSAFASFRSRVSNPSVNQAVDRSQQFASLLLLALVTPEASEAYCGT
jgi:hypothetical protein